MGTMELSELRCSNLLNPAVVNQYYLIPTTAIRRQAFPRGVI